MRTFICGIHEWKGTLLGDIKFCDKSTSIMHGLSSYELLAMEVLNERLLPLLLFIYQK